MDYEPNTWKSALALWRRLSFTGAVLGLLFLFFYTLEHVDGWLFFASTVEIAADTAIRILGLLVLVVLFGGLVVLFALILFGQDPQRFSNHALTLAHTATVIATLLCSLLLWRAVFIWLDIVKLYTMPFGIKYPLWMLIVMVACAALWSKRRDTMERLEAPFTGTTTRRSVIAAGLGAVAVAVARPLSSIQPVAAAAPLAAGSRKPNVILVTFDALSAADMSLHGYRLPTTPNIDAFARASSVFDNFYSCSTFTTPCVASILTGRYPLNTRVFHAWGHLRGEAAAQTLGSELSAAGYRTAASVANVLAFPPRLGVKFDLVPTPPVKGVVTAPPLLLDDILYLQTNGRKILEIRFPELFGTTETSFPPEASFAQAESLLRLLKPPFFLWVHVMAPHFPYQPSAPFLNRFIEGSDMRMMRDIVPLLNENSRYYNLAEQPTFDRWRLRYDEWVAQADSAFGQFLSRLESARTLDNTALIVSADHGESFEGGAWGHASRTQLRQMIHVPLIVHMPGNTEGRRIAVVADETAIAPTILEMAGVATPKWMDGRSLMPWIRGDASGETNGVAFTQYFEKDSIFKPVTHGTVGCVEGQYQYVFDLESGKGSLYELADANVQGNDIAAREPHIAASMHEMILSRFPELRRGAA